MDARRAQRPQGPQSGGFKGTGGATALVRLVETHHGQGERERAVIKLLLDHKADPNVKGVNGKTALGNALADGDAETAALLRKHGAQ